MSVQSQISMVTEKLNSMQCMIRNREQCLRKLADVQVRPIQLVAPRPEPDQTFQRCKSPLFSPKHGITSSIAFFLTHTQQFNPNGVSSCFAVESMIKHRRYFEHWRGSCLLLSRMFLGTVISLSYLHVPLAFNSLTKLCSWLRSKGLELLLFCQHFLFVLSYMCDILHRCRL